MKFHKKIVRNFLGKTCRYEHKASPDGPKW